MGMDRRTALRLVFALWALNALLPVFAMIHRSLTPGGGFSLSAYARMFTWVRQWALLENSLELALATALVAALLGLPLSLLLARTDLPGRKTLLILFVLPLLLPPTILAYGWSILLAGDGLLGKIWGHAGASFLFSSGGGVLVLATSFLPLVLFFTIASLLSANPRLEEAGRLSARTPRILLGITVPQAAPALLTASLFCLALETGAPTFLRINVFAVESLAQFSAFYDFASATAAATRSLRLTLLAFWGFHFFGTGRGRPAACPCRGGPRTHPPGAPPPLPALLRGTSVGGSCRVAFVRPGFRSADPNAFAEALTRAGAGFAEAFFMPAWAPPCPRLRIPGRMRPDWRSLEYWSGDSSISLCLPDRSSGSGSSVSGTGRPPGASTDLQRSSSWGCWRSMLILGAWITKSALMLIPRSMEEAAAMRRLWTTRLAQITIPLARKAWWRRGSWRSSSA
jgi:iron(III) transport system permease protein